MVRAVLEAEDEAMPLRFVGSLPPSSSSSNAMAGLRSVLGHDMAARDYYALELLWKDCPTLTPNPLPS